jgi:histidinol-phosphatase (PHP family)
MTNYHTHTYRCGHASGDVADYVREARVAGLTELGFSDHVPHPDGRWPWGRMSGGELPGYVLAVEAAREAEAARPGGGILIHLGLECEWSEDLRAYYREELMGAFGVEYLIAGIHVYGMDEAWLDSFAIDSARGLRAYARQVEGAAASGLFSCLAHPDVFCNGYLSWNADAEACARDVLAACEATGLPLEVNANGLRKPRIPSPEGRRPPYPHRRFWELAAEYDVRAIAGSDAHRPRDVADGLAACGDLARGCGVATMERLPLAAASMAG